MKLLRFLLPKLDSHRNKPVIKNEILAAAENIASLLFPADSLVKGPFKCCHLHQYYLVQYSL